MREIEIPSGDLAVQARAAMFSDALAYHLRSTLSEIEAAGLFKRERLIDSSQNSVVRLKDGLEVISSSFIDNMEDPDTSKWIYKPVFTKPSVEEIATWTDAATLGYTTAEIAFTPGTWGMGNHS